MAIHNREFVMNSVFIPRLLFVCLLVLPLAVVSEERPQSPVDIPDFSTLVATPDIKEPLTLAQLNHCIKETERVLKVEGSRPQIVVMQLSPAEAKRLGLSHTILLSNKGHTASPSIFYEVWIVGSYPVADLARAVEMVYELHYGLNYTDAQRGQAVKRISGLLGSTVSVKALQEQGETSDK